MSELYRVAAPDEIAVYERILCPLQDRIFACASIFGDAFVLTGGTALARIHFQHRLSEHIDLFTDRAPHEIPELVRGLVREIEHAGIRADRYRQPAPSFARFFVADGTARIQVDVAVDNPRVEPVVASPLGIRAHTLRDIAANKLVAYEDRAEAKDVIDLYYLNRALSWGQIFADAERKRLPVEYDHLKHILAQPISGSAFLIKPIAQSDLDEFVMQLKRQLDLRWNGPRVGHHLL